MKTYIPHPVFEQGRQAHRDGATENDNPFIKGTPQWYDWLQGRRQGMHDAETRNNNPFAQTKNI